ncbi:MAG: hypothetical protein KGL44_00790 [Sphingomonadales bacterium]|nr:hypothetical protein [Sphingomonadales bacterium]
MPNPQINHPSLSVPFVALAFGAAGDAAVPVTPASGLPMREAPYAAARALAANTVVTPGRAVMADCSVAGPAVLELADASQITLTLPAGLLILPLAVQRFLAAGTTAVFSAWVLD